MEDKNGLDVKLSERSLARYTSWIEGMKADAFSWRKCPKCKKDHGVDFTSPDFSDVHVEFSKDANDAYEYYRFKFECRHCQHKDNFFVMAEIDYEETQP